MKSTVNISEKQVVVYHPKATITINLDGSEDYLVAVNRHNSHQNTEVIPRKPHRKEHLLDALTKVRTWLMAPNTSDESLDEMTSIVRAAIAKAEGEASERVEPALVGRPGMIAESVT